MQDDSKSYEQILAKSFTGFLEIPKKKWLNFGDDANFFATSGLF